MDAASTRQVQARLLQDKTVAKKLAKDLHALLQAAPSPPAQIHASLESFQTNLDTIALSLVRASRVKHIADRELEAFRGECDDTETRAAQATADIERLEARLASAQLERTQRLEYDEICKDIFRVTSRAQGEETIGKLEADINELTGEQRSYEQTWTARQQRFDVIVASLQQMLDVIKDEKLEKERQLALANGDDDDDGDATGQESKPDAAETPSQEEREEGEEMDVS